MVWLNSTLLFLARLFHGWSGMFYIRSNTVSSHPISTDTRTNHGVKVLIHRSLPCRTTFHHFDQQAVRDWYLDTIQIYNVPSAFHVTGLVSIVNPCLYQSQNGDFPPPSYLYTHQLAMFCNNDSFFSLLSFNSFFKFIFYFFKVFF